MPFEFLPLSFLACNQQYPPFISRNYTSILFSILKKFSSMKFEFRSHNAVSLDSLFFPSFEIPRPICIHFKAFFLLKSSGDTFFDPLGPTGPIFSKLKLTSCHLCRSSSGAAGGKKSNKKWSLNFRVLARLFSMHFLSRNSTMEYVHATLPYQRLYYNRFPRNVYMLLRI